jgi:hypothetical protein
MIAGGAEGCCCCCCSCIEVEGSVDEEVSAVEWKGGSTAYAESEKSGVDEVPNC